MVVISAIVNKRIGAKLFLTGFLFFGAAVTNDILKSFEILHTPNISSYGFLTFVIFQSAILSRKFANAFTDAENSTNELKQLSESLEKKVTERTLELQTEKDNLLIAKDRIENLAESRKKLSLIGQMAAGIVHDIKNPMATIKSLAEMANSDRITKETRIKNLDLIVREMDRLNDLAFEILDFSKGEIVLDISEVNVKEFVSEVAQFLKIDFSHYGIRYNEEYLFEGMIRIDRDRMRRVLINLAKNAIEAMYDGKKEYRFMIRTEKKEGKILFSLIDNGPGISESMEERIFEAFATQGKVTGTGLGLFMSKWIVESHLGNLSFETKQGDGTTFFISIPG
ncbi:MAG: sensor histidine kinase [Leptospira sp.]|nr:sensor histidine kinase [Leptospira sp.]